MCFSWNTKRKTFLLTNTFAGNNHTRASSFWQINNSCTFVSTFLCLCIFTGQRCTRSGAYRWKHSILLTPKTKNWKDVTSAILENCPEWYYHEIIFCSVCINNCVDWGHIMMHWKIRGHIWHWIVGGGRWLMTYGSFRYKYLRDFWHKYKYMLW